MAKATVAQDLQLAFYAEAKRQGYAQGEFRIPKIITGPDASSELAAMPCDVVLNGITGSVGLQPTLAALDAGNTLALANKESLVIGGPLVTRRVKPGQIVPVDSEHSAIAQCLRGGSRRRGPQAAAHRQRRPVPGPAAADLADVTVEQALAHPNFAMGPVVTINSATLVNKGLELIEAHLLFGIPMDRVDVVVHPQQAVHSMVEFYDGSTLAQVSPPTMTLPIALGLGWPDRIPDASPPWNWAEASTLGVPAARRRGVPLGPAGPRGRDPRRTAPAVFNAANEVCVAGVPGRAAAVPGDRRHRGPGGDRTRRTLVRGTVHRRRTRRGRLGARPGPGTDRRRNRPQPGDHEGMTALLTVIGIVLFVLGILVSVGAPRARSHAAREGVRHEGDPVLRRLRPDASGPPSAARPSTGSRRSRPAGSSGSSACCRRPRARTRARSARPTPARSSRWSRTPARAEYETIDPADNGRLFYQKVWWKKLIVMASGPMVNVVIAFVLFGGLFMLYGASVAQTTVATVTDCVDPGRRRPRPTASASRATRSRRPSTAGFQVGDKIVSFNGTTITSWDQLTPLIRANTDKPAIDRCRAQRPAADAADQHDHQPGAATRRARTRSSRSASSASRRSMKVERQDFGFVVNKMGELTVATVKAIGNFPEKLVGVAKSIVGGDRDQDSPMSVVGASRVAGEIASNKSLDRRRADRLPDLAARLAEPVPRAVQLHPAAAAGRRPHGRRDLGRHPAWASPSCSAGPTRGTSTSPSCCPIAYVAASVIVVMGVLLVIADIVNPIRLFNG